MKLLAVICLTVLLVTMVTSNPIDEIEDVAENEIADENADIEGEAFKAADDDEEDSESDEVELTEDEKERIFGIEIPMCVENTDFKVDLHFSHKTDCNKFYSCSFGKAHLMDCPGNQHWSVQLDRCDYQRLAKCATNGEYQIKKRKTKVVRMH